VIPRELLGTAKIPGQADELQLYRHDRDFIFRVHGTELMSSRVHGSEELLAELALARLPDTSTARVLVGGLGMGFTLATVLGLVGAEARVEVAELVPEVVAWNHEWLGDLNGHPLRDVRVHVVEADVAQRIRDARTGYDASAGYDAILLDVDNGPEGLTRSSNDWLYEKAGLTAARAALRSGGVLAIWSSTLLPWFSDRLRDAGFQVNEERVRARRTKGARHMIWLALRPQR
jgi:spermidine synthase